VRAPPRGVDDHDGEGMLAASSVKRRGHNCVSGRESAARGARDDLVEWRQERVRQRERLGGHTIRARRNSGSRRLLAGKAHDDWDGCRVARARRVTGRSPDGLGSSRRRRGRKKETDPGRGAFVFLCALDPPSPSPLARARVSRTGDTLDLGSHVISWP
jgi:hypothetical protein